MLKRLISAAIALPIALAIIHAGGIWFFGLVLFVAAVCLIEFMGMALPGDAVGKWVLTGVGLLLIPYVATGYALTPAGAALFPIGLVGVLLFFLFRTGDMTTVAPRLGMAFIGMFWTAGLMAGLSVLRLLPGGVGWIYMACAFAWGSDTGGYFAGKYLGKKKLYPKVSPKKTWAGSVGGVIAATAIAFGIQRLLGQPDIPATHLLVVGPIGAALGQMGDLAESMLKRSTGVKDSGSIMPGHGGLFDRVDALLFTGAVLLAYAVTVRGLVPAWFTL